MKFAQFLPVACAFLAGSVALPGCGASARLLALFRAPREEPSPIAPAPEAPAGRAPAGRAPARMVSADLSGPTGLVRFGDPELDHVRPTSRVLTNLRQHTFTNVGRDFDPDIHPDGERLVFASTRNAVRADIFYKHVDGFTITQLTSEPADDVQPRFSPDGKRVVFCSNRTGNWDIWMLELDGAGLVQLTDDRADEIAPCWSPDGRQVAFTLWGHQSRQWELWVLDVDAPGVRRFLAYGMFPDWSPDGRCIAFQRARQRGTRWFSVWTIELRDGEARHPTEIASSDAAACIVPRWSPDGRMLVYAVVREQAGATGRTGELASAELWTVEAATGRRSKLVAGRAAALNPAWSPDGRVYFVSSGEGAENIWSAAPEHGAGGPADRNGGAGAGG